MTGWMAGVMKGTGSIITWMGRVCTLGKMAGDMKVDTLRTKNTGLGATPGLMDASTRACGKTAGNMD